MKQRIAYLLLSYLLLSPLAALEPDTDTDHTRARQHAKPIALDQETGCEANLGNVQKLLERMQAREQELVRDEKTLILAAAKKKKKAKKKKAKKKSKKKKAKKRTAGR